MGKIEGNIVGLPSPRSDWNQTDKRKADFIKNKPDISGMLNDKVDTSEYEQFKRDLADGEFQVSTAAYADNAVCDIFGKVIHNTYAKISPVKVKIPDVSASNFSILEPNITYSIGDIYDSDNPDEIPHISFGFSSVANDGDVIYISFYSTSNADPNVKINVTNILGSENLPDFKSSALYEIYGKYNQHLEMWLIGASEYTD